MTLRELLDAATPGPWENAESVTHYVQARDIDYGTGSISISSDDAKLAAALVNNAPAIIELWEAAALPLIDAHYPELAATVEKLRPLMEETP